MKKILWAGSVQTVLCREVVFFSERPLSEVPWYSLILKCHSMYFNSAHTTAFLPPVLSSPVLTVSEGEDVQEACLNLNPAPLIPSTENAQQWLDPSGNSALAQSNVLTILNITHFQAGEYRCVLTSIRDSTTSATLTITVQCEWTHCVPLTSNSSREGREGGKKWWMDVQ